MVFRLVLLALFCLTPALVLAQAPRLVLQEGHAAQVTAMEVSPYGTTLVTADRAGQVNVWDLKTLKLRFTLNRYCGPAGARSIFFTAMGDYFGVQPAKFFERYLSRPDETDTLLMFGTTDGKPVNRGYLPDFGARFLPDRVFLSASDYAEWQGSALFTGSSLALRVFNRPEENRTTNCSAKITAIEATPGGDTLFAGTDSGTVQVFSGTSLTLLREFRHGVLPVNRLQYIPGTGLLCVSSSGGISGGGSFAVYHAAAGKPVFSLPPAEDMLRQPVWAVSRNGASIAITLHDTIIIINARRLSITYTAALPLSAWGTQAVSFSPADPDHLFLAGNTIAIFSISARALVYTFPFIPMRNTDLYSFLPDGSLATVTGTSGGITALSFATLQRRQAVPASFGMWLQAGSDSIPYALDNSYGNMKSMVLIPGSNSAGIRIMPRFANEATGWKVAEYDFAKDQVTRISSVPHMPADSLQKAYLQLEAVLPRQGINFFSDNHIGSGTLAAADTTGRELFRAEVVKPMGVLPAVTIAPGETYAAWLTTDTAVAVYSLPEFRLVFKSTPGKKEWLPLFAFMNGGTEFIWVQQDSASRFALFTVNLATGTVTPGGSSAGYPSALAVSPNGMVALGTWNNFCVVAGGGITPRVLPLQSPPVALSFRSDGSRLCISTGKGMHYLYNPLQDSIALSFTALSDGYIYLTPGGNYYITGSAANTLAYSVNGVMYPFETFDAWFNRPDAVLEALGEAAPQTIALFRKARERRFAAQGTPDQLPRLAQLPVTTTRAAAGEAEGEQSLAIQATDSSAGIALVRVRVNDVPVAELKAGGGKTETLNCPLKLSAGANLVAVTAVNTLGDASVPELLFLTGPPASSRLLFLAGCVSRYKDSTRNLTYAVKDGRDLAAKFSAAAGYASVLADTIFNEALVPGTLARWRTLLAQTSVADVAVLFLSGHGLLDSSGQFYFAAHGCNFNNPAEGGISLEQIEALFAGVPARQRLVLIDACHSGELEAGGSPVVLAVPPGGGVAEGAAFGSKGSRLAAAPPRVTDSDAGAWSLMKQIFADVSAGTGTQIIAAAAGRQYALESGAWQNGAFTYALLTALGGYYQTSGYSKLQDGTLRVSELTRYVAATVEELTGGAQQPVARRVLFNNDFVIWRYW